MINQMIIDVKIVIVERKLSPLTCKFETSQNYKCRKGIQFGIIHGCQEKI